MKNPYFLTLIVLFFISLQACDRQNTTKEDLMIFDIDKAGDQISFNIKNIFSSGEIVKLENNPEALLGRVTASAITENYIILYNQSGLILLFDRNGNFIRHIGQKGKGPFEYKYVNGLTVSDNEDIVLVDRALLNDFVGYSINGEGEFKVERKNQGRHMFSLFGTNEILSIGYHEHSFKGGTDSVNLYHLGSDGSIQHTNSSFRSIRQIRVGGITIPQYMYKYKDNFRVHLGQDTLYTYNVEEKVLKKTAVFTSSSLKFNYKKLNEDKERSSFNEEDILGHIFVEIYAETKDYYLLQGVKAEKYSFIYEGETHSATEAMPMGYYIAEKKTGKVNLVHLVDPFWGIDLQKMANSMPFNGLKFSGNHYAYIVYDAIDFKEDVALLISKCTNPETKEKLRILDENLSEEDNSILFIYELKK